MNKPKKSVNDETKEIDGPMVKQIDGNTHVIFTMKNFFALISTMLGLFFGFYLLVVQPRIERTETHYDMMYNEQKELNKVYTKEITDIKLRINMTSDNLLLKNRASGGAINPAPIEANNEFGNIFDGNILANITRFR
jgi:hypothetical protein